MNRYLEYFLSRFHTLLLSFNGAIDLGSGSLIFYKSKIVNKSLSGGVKIGSQCRIGTSSLGYHAGMPFYTSILNDGVKSRVEIGNNCRINGAYIHAEKSIVIGDNCVIAAGVSLIDSNGHEINSANRTVGRDKPSSITLGNNVWIGLNAIILKDTTIGENSIVAAGSVVKGHFPANSLLQGNPAKKVKELNIK